MTRSSPPLLQTARGVRAPGSSDVRESLRTYVEKCNEVAAKGYEGFSLSQG
jgi:hypothetical protein